MELLVSQYLDGRLGQAETSRLERRLAVDGELREQLRLYSRLDGVLKEGYAHPPAGVDYDAQRAEIAAAVERSVLLEGLARRRLVFRPVFAALAAAAVLLVAASAALLAYRPAAPASTGAKIEVAVVSVAPPAVGAGQLTVSLVRPAPGDVPELAMTSDDDLPAGIVIASVGGGEGPPEASGFEMFGLPGI